MPVLSPSGILGEAGPAGSSIETSGWQPRQTRRLMILSVAWGWLLSSGLAPQAISGCTVAMQSCAIAVADQASTPAAIKPDALAMTIPGCSVTLGSMTQDSSTYWKK